MTASDDRTRDKTLAKRTNRCPEVKVFATRSPLEVLPICQWKRVTLVQFDADADDRLGELNHALLDQPEMPHGEGMNFSKLPPSLAHIPTSGYNQTAQSLITIEPHHMVNKENTVKNETVQVERKKFVISLKENPRGRFLRITEDAKGNCSSIIIPSTGLEEFQRVLTEMVKAEKGLPVPAPAPASHPAEPDDSSGNR